MVTGSITFRNYRYKVADLSAAKEFYSRAFGVQPYFDEPTWVVFEIHDHQLWLEPADSGEASVYESVNTLNGPLKHSTLTFWVVVNVKVICERFRNLGGSIFKVPRREGPYTNAIVIDPWGNKIGLSGR